VALSRSMGTLACVYLDRLPQLAQKHFVAQIVRVDCTSGNAYLNTQVPLPCHSVHVHMSGIDKGSLAPGLLSLVTT
jgi:hypothetical protein